MTPDETPDVTAQRWVRAMLVLYLVAVLVATVQRGLLGIENNFAIFRWSFFHLVEGVDLYAPAPGQFDDLFKYSPTFALLIGPFAPWPFAVGLTLWNALNAIGVWYAVTRLLPGVLGDDASSADESFSAGLLEYPQYTRPEEFRGMRVPEILLSGDHGKIRVWREAEALRVTARRRPELVVNKRKS